MKVTGCVQWFLGAAVVVLVWIGVTVLISQPSSGSSDTRVSTAVAMFIAAAVFTAIFVVVWREAAKAKRVNAGKTDHQVEGYETVEPLSQWCTDCRWPFYTGENAKEPAGIGSIWRCPVCGRRWELTSHEYRTSFNRMTGSGWRALDA